jgi:hypothetical protein
MVPPEEALRVILEVVRVLEDLRVPYAVGGSLASSLHGIPRSTQDGDLVADLRGEHVKPFVAAVAGSTDNRPHRLFIEARHRQDVWRLLVELEDLAGLQAETPPNRRRDGDLALRSR